MSSDVQVLQPQGILDGTKASQFRQEISNLVDQGAKTILIDFKDVSFMDSSGLGALVLALKTVRAAGSKLMVCSINEQIKILFELTIEYSRFLIVEKILKASMPLKAAKI